MRAWQVRCLNIEFGVELDDPVGTELAKVFQDLSLEGSRTWHEIGLKVSSLAFQPFYGHRILLSKKICEYQDPSPWHVP